MSQYSLDCAQCAATLKYGEDLFGKMVNCPRCQTSVTIPFPEVAAFEEDVTLTADDMVEDDDAPVMAEVLPDGSTATVKKPKKKKKKKKKKQGWTMPAIVLEPVVWQLIAGVVGVVAFVAVFFFLTRWPDAPLLEAGLWKLHEKPLYKVLLPGTVKTQVQNQAGVSMEMLQAMPSKDASFGVAVSDGRMPAGRLNDGAEAILNDACSGSAANLEQMGAVEVSRKSITLQNYPGKQLTMKISQAKGYMIMRGYLVGTRLYMVMVGGKGLHEKHPDVVKFFDSFVILEQVKEEKKPEDGQAGNKKEPAKGH